MPDTKVASRDLITLLILSLVWGSSFILIKKTLMSFSAVQLGCARISISFLAFLPVLYFQRANINWKKWPFFAIVGLTGSGIPAFLYGFAQQYVNSSTAGLLNSLTPIFTLLIGVFIFHDRFHLGKLGGVLLGFFGAALLIYQGADAGFKAHIWYALLIVLASICYATSINIVKQHLSDVPPLIVSAVSFSIVAPPALVYFILSGAMPEILSHSDSNISMLSILILALLGTVSATIFYYSLVQRTNPVFASSVAYLMPLVAIMWGVLDGEVLGWTHFVAMACILAAITVIRKF